jgi:hypothetical protein
MRGWIREDPTPARTLIRVAYGGTRDVPKSLVIRETQRYGGTVVSWTVPIYILTSEPEDVLPPDESPEPENGNPHPQFFVGPVPPQDHWAPPMDQGWGDWNAEGQAGNDNVDVNPGWDLPGPDIMQQLPSSMSIQLTDQTNSSIHLVPGEGPVLVQQGSIELIEIEDITEDLEEEYPQNAVVHDTQEYMENAHLALVSYKYSAWHYVWSQFGSSANTAHHALISDQVQGDTLGMPASLMPSINVDPAVPGDSSGSDASVQDTADMLLDQFVVPPAEGTRKRGRGKKAVPASEEGVRRSTRQAAIKQGYKAEPINDQLEPKKETKKKPKSKPSKENVAPFTPIKVIQQVGAALEIPADKLTEEKLMASSVQDSTSGV